MLQTTFDAPPMGRAAEVRAATINDEARTVEVLFSTGAAVRRATWDWDEGVRQYEEELVVSPEAMRMDRLNAGAPFLNSHSAWTLSDVLGVVEPGTVRIEGGNAYATIRFSDREDVEPVWRDIRSGIIRNVSVGYRVHRYEVTKQDGQLDRYRAVDWEPMEISAVAIGADPGAQVRGADSTRAPALNTCLVIRAETSAAVAADHQRSSAMEREETTATGAANQPDTTPATQAPEATRSAGNVAVEVLDLTQRHGLSVDFARGLIARGVSMDQARSAVLDELAQRDTRGAGRISEGVPASAVGNRLDETDTRRRGIEDAMFAMVRGTEPTEIARPFMARSLVALAARAMGDRELPEGFGQREEVLRRAFHSTADFPLLFENAMNRALGARYQDARPVYRMIARQRAGGYADFRDHSTVRMGDFPKMQEVSPEGGEVKAGTVGEARERTAAKAYGVVLNLSRQMLVNDSLGGLQQVLSDQGAAVARFEEEVFFAMMLSGANADGPTLTEGNAQVFGTGATRLNKAGTAAAINVTSIGLGRAAMLKQTSIDGAKLNISPSILLCGPDKITEAETLVATIVPNQQSAVNPFTGRLRPESTAWITGNAWYLFADPSVAPCFEWGLLQGYEAPRFRIDEPFGRQGIGVSLEHDFGCGAIDFRGGYKNAGA